MDGSEQPLKGATDLGERCVSTGGAYDDEDVPASAPGLRRLAQNLTDASMDTIARDGSTDAATRSDSEAIVAEGVWNEADDHEPMSPGTALRLDAGEVLPGTQCRHGAPPGVPAVRR